MTRKRLDVLCHERGLSRSREQARREILAGWVRVAGETIIQPSRSIDEASPIEISRPGGLYVSRGGEKLARALEFFSIDVTGLTCADLGASTGGFSHCLLEKGAAKVYAVDVGYGQFDYSLRSDNRVVLYERTNVRDLGADHFNEPVNFVAADLSFISLQKVAAHLGDLFGPIPAVLLVKPQFEAGPGEQKKGVVRQAANHVAILERTLRGLAALGVGIKGLTWSPLVGPKGNIEFLLFCNLKDVSGTQNHGEMIDEAVTGAHRALIH